MGTEFRNLDEVFFFFHFLLLGTKEKCPELQGRVKENCRTICPQWLYVALDHHSR